MARPSEPLLAWLREKLKSKGLNTAHVAEASSIDRSRLRKILSGSEDMTIDELMMISDALQLDPADLTAQAQALEAPTTGPAPVSNLEPSPLDGVDPFGNQPEQLFRIAFAMGCDFMFLADVTELADSGVPKHYLVKYDDAMPIELKAAYHTYNEPRYDHQGITLTLSFDALYDCTFPWSSIRRLILEPLPPEPEPEPSEEEEAAPAVPFLRLVT